MTPITTYGLARGGAQLRAVVAAVAVAAVAAVAAAVVVDVAEVMTEAVPSGRFKQAMIAES